jgi:hypothetical protein
MVGTWFEPRVGRAISDCYWFASACAELQIERCRASRLRRLSSTERHIHVAEAYSEVSRMFSFSNGYYLIPYLELGAHYQVVRPNGGAILTGDLLTAFPSPWSGSLLWNAHAASQ